MSRIAFVFLLLVGWQSASADDVAEKLKICAAIEDSAGRLACFDSIGRTSEPAPEPPSVAEPPPAPPALTPAVMEPDAEPDPESATEPVESAAVEPPPNAPESPTVEPASPERAGSVEMGTEAIERQQKQKEKNDKKRKKDKKPREVVSATIVSVTEQLDGRWTITLDNGQVWRESQGSKVGIPDDGASVELFKGRFGGYRMNIDGLYRTAWVKRKR